MISQPFLLKEIQGDTKKWEHLKNTKKIKEKKKKKNIDRN
jgi:hypothetical protein